MALILAGCGIGETAESRYPPATFFGVIVEAHEQDYLIGLRPATSLDPGTPGSSPVWAIPGELYRRSGDVAVMSTGQFGFSGDDSMTNLGEECGSTPWWEIDPDSGAVVAFAGWGSALFDNPW